MDFIPKTIDSLRRFVKQVGQCSHGKLAWAFALLIAVPASLTALAFTVVWLTF